MEKYGYHGQIARMNHPRISHLERVRQTIRGKQFWYVVLALYLLVLLFLSLNPWVRPASGAAPLMSPDKFDHVLAYGGLAVIHYLCFQKSIIDSGRAWIAALLAAIVIGILIELAQTLFTHHRSGSFADAVANAIGAGLGYMAFHLFKFIVRD